MEATRESWKRIIRDLYESFQRTDQEMILLREIDHAIIEHASEPGAIETVFTTSVQQLSRIYALAMDGAVYAYIGDRLLLLADDAAPTSPESLNTSDAIERLAHTPGSLGELRGRDEALDGLFDQLPAANTILLQPIYTDDNRLFAVLLFRDSEQKEGSRLADPEFRNTVKAISRQLTIAYRHRVRSDQEELLRGLWELFLNSDLAPTRCFRDLAQMVPRAFPTFGPLGLPAEPEVQILVLERTPDDEPHFLTIRGTTGDEPSITKINIEDSICGLLIEQTEKALPFFCDDPRRPEYRGRYKNYLERDNPIQTEFAVRLISSVGTGETIGVLNIESEVAEAFNVHHQAAIVELASRIAPMVTVFEDRIDHNRLMHLSVGSATANYLDSLAGIFRHGIASPLVALRAETTAGHKIIDRKLRPLLEPLMSEAPVGATARGDIDEELADLHAGLENLDGVHRQIKEFATEFASGISGFGPMGRFDLRRLVEQTVSLAGRSRLAPNDAEIRITVDGEPEAYAFCSRLFKQHMFSLLTNSIFSIQERATDGPVRGTVAVTIERDTDPDISREVTLNRRWVVRVRDDGAGADEATMAKLRLFQPGNHFRPTLPGQGLGLVAVQRYMGSIGGWIKLDSVASEWFEVRLLFDEYRQDIHGPMSTHVEGAGNGA